MYKSESDAVIFVDKQVRVPTFTMTYQHSHPYCEIFYLKKGSCIYYVNNSMIHLTTGDFFIIPPKVLHYTSYEGLTPCERIVVNCRTESISDLFWDAHRTLRENISRPGKVLLAKSERARAEYLLERMIEENNIPDEFSSELLAFLTMELFIHIQRNGTFLYEQLKPRSESSSDMEDLLRYLARNYSQPITQGEMARKVSLTPTYFSRKFKRATGVTFKEYMNYIRIRRASQALITTDDSITKIAIDCGFNSSNYFKDVFRKINGVSPRTFRKQANDRVFSYNIPKSNAIPLQEGGHLYDL